MMLRKARLLSAKLFLVAALLVVAVPAVSHAHEGVYSFKYLDGEHVVIGHQNVHDAQTGVPITYNLRLYDLIGKPLPFANVQAEILRGNKTELAKTLPMSKNTDAAFEQTYTKADNYTLRLQFTDEDGESLAAAEFPFVVQQGLVKPSLAETVFAPATILAFVVGGAAALAIAVLLYRSGWLTKASAGPASTKKK